MEKNGLNDEIGDVLKVEGGMATVLFDRKAACASCKACGLFAENQKKVCITLTAPKNMAAGDRAKLVMDNRYYGVSLLLLYCLPCCALVLGIVIGTLIWGKQGQAGSALLGLGLTAAAYLIVRSQDKKLAEWRKGKLALVKVESAAENAAGEGEEND